VDLNSIMMIMYVKSVVKAYIEYGVSVSFTNYSRVS
jgi:hypothetical protein